MESITQIIDNINNFSRSNFKFTKLIDPLLLLNHVPDKITDFLNSDDFIFHLEQSFSHIHFLLIFLITMSLNYFLMK